MGRARAQDNRKDSTILMEWGRLGVWEFEEDLDLQKFWMPLLK
jgi:hypothetical protein